MTKVMQLDMQKHLVWADGEADAQETDKQVLLDSGAKIYRGLSRRRIIEKYMNELENLGEYLTTGNTLVVYCRVNGVTYKHQVYVDYAPEFWVDSGKKAIKSA